MKDPWADECNVDLEMCIVCRFVEECGEECHKQKKEGTIFVGDNRKIGLTGELDCEKGGKQCLLGWCSETVDSDATF